MLSGEDLTLLGDGFTRQRKWNGCLKTNQALMQAEMAHFLVQVLAFTWFSVSNRPRWGL